MSKRTKLVGTLHVLSVGILSYVAQISNVPAEEIARWGLHEWTRSGLLVALAVLSAWKLLLTNPNDITSQKLP